MLHVFILGMRISLLHFLVCAEFSSRVIFAKNVPSAPGIVENAAQE